MTTAAAKPQILRGGEWLLTPTPAAAVFRPELLTEEHRLIKRTLSDFISREVLPVVDRLEAKDWTLARALLKKAGDLGMFGIEAPEEYGGAALDKVSSLVVSESIVGSASFGAAFGAHANLMVQALVLFGNEAQKQKYLPRLLAGEIVGAYCLSEPGSGSDALGARTRADRQPDGSFVLNGEKAWITNGGFADLYIVFAKVDGEHFSAFIVERSTPGVTPGREEHKMGLHGSSTTPVVLQEARVPGDCLLGEIGKGHKIAFNVLNFARFKLGATCVGGARLGIGEAAKYAATRRQFGVPIGSFGAIKHKLGEMTARTYAIESLTHRTAGLIDARIASQSDPSGVASTLAAFEEHAVEASIAKVAGSELVDFVLDENIQIHGGNGFVRDYPAERHYRDARVNRIFEGTNEINRLLIPGMLARRAVKGDLALIPAAMALQEELLGPQVSASSGGTLAEERRVVDACKKGCLMILGLAMQTYRERLNDQQEVLMQAADMLIDTFAADSALLRATAVVEANEPSAELHTAAARAFVSAASMRIDAAAREALGTLTEGDTLRTMMAAERRLFRQMPIDITAARRTLAEAAITRGGYPLE